MKRVTAKELKEIDRRAIEEYGIAAVVLMENAGAFAARTALEMAGEAKKGKILVFCGAGNNGGDGMVAARHLLNAGKDVRVFLIGEKSKVKGPALANMHVLLRMDVHIGEIKDEGDTEKAFGELKGSALIVDAIFGTGLTGDVRGPAKLIIRAINKSGRAVLGVDTPSGLDSDTGEVLGEAVRARVTATFGLAKKGFFEKEGPGYVGELKVSDIGMPRQLLDQYGR